MNKNEVINFEKQYSNSICLNKDLVPVKLIGLSEESPTFFKTKTEQGNILDVPVTELIIPLKGRLKNRDYDSVVSTFHRKLNSNK